MLGLPGQGRAGTTRWWSSCRKILPKVGANQTAIRKALLRRADAGVVCACAWWCAKSGLLPVLFTVAGDDLTEGAGLEVEIALNGSDAVQANRFKFVEGDIPLFFLLHNLMFIRWVCRVSDC